MDRTPSYGSIVLSKSNSTLSNLIWKFAERITAQVVTLIVSIFLARLLAPEHYGIISIVMIFITIANVFVSDGFGSALIQKKDADELDFNSVLWFNILFSSLLYFILYILAPVIAAFYGEGYELITPVLRVLGLRLIISAINSVQQAYVSRHMIFQKFFWATLFGTVLSGVVGIYMAYSGFGVWALVGQYLTNTIVDTIVLQYSLRIKPKLQFSLKRLQLLIGFGSRILATNLLMAGYQELRALIIGKIYTSADLAYYDRAKQFPTIITNNINSSISAVLFPRMSKSQDDVNEIKEIAKRSIRFGTYIMSPMMLGMLAVSKQFVSLILTDKWLPCVPLLRLLCINSLCMPLHSANMQAIKAVGRSDITLRVELIKKVIELVVLLSVMNISVSAITCGMVGCSICFIFVNAYPNIRLIGYSFAEQLKDIFPGIMMSIVMAVLVMVIGKINLDELPLLIIQIISGIVIYVLLSIVSHNPEFQYIFNIIRNKTR